LIGFEDIVCYISVVFETQCRKQFVIIGNSYGVLIVLTVLFVTILG